MDKEIVHTVKSYGILLVWVSAILLGVVLLLLALRGNPYHSVELGYRQASEVDAGLRSRILFVSFPLLSILFSFASAFLLTYDGMRDTESLVLWGRYAVSRVIFPRLLLFFTFLMATALLIILLMGNFYTDVPDGAIFMASITSATYVGGISAVVSGFFRNPLAGFLLSLLLSAYFGILPSSVPGIESPLRTLLDPYFLLHHPNLISGEGFIFGREGPVFLLNQGWCFLIGLGLFFYILQFFQFYKRHFF